jgi:hypothetical protein
MNNAHILEPKCPSNRPLNKIAENRRYLIERYGESYEPEFRRFGCRVNPHLSLIKGLFSVCDNMND